VDDTRCHCKKTAQAVGGGLKRTFNQGDSMKRAARSLSIVVAASGVLLAPTAFATVTATATLSDLHYQLFDLDLTDGIAPFVTFTGGASVFTSATPNGVTQDIHSADGALWSALSVSSLLGSNSASARTTAGTPVGVGVGPGAVAIATAAGANSVSFANSVPMGADFTLSAHTLLVFTASTSGVGVTNTQAGENGYVYATVSLYSPNYTGQSSYGQSYAQLNADGSRDSSLAPLVAASFVNLSSASIAGNAYVQVYAQVYGVTVVPEPETYVMFLAGLASVAFLVQRRQHG
jgi:hypothetical protein